MQCPHSHCISTRLVCDGITDCPDGEDEHGCGSRSCPGLLHCRSDNVCVHPLEICDGVRHCLMSGDDEAICFNAVCPSSCSCLGYSVFCNDMKLSLHLLLPGTKIIVCRDVAFLNQFTVKHITYLKYMKCIRCIFYGNALQIMQFARNVHLASLFFIQCNIHTVDQYIFNKTNYVSTLDLSGNEVPTIKSHTFTGLRILKTLNLSYLHIEYIQARAFYQMDNLELLNISDNLLLRINAEMFDGLPQLKVLDISSNRLINFITLYIDSKFVSSQVLIYFDSPIHCCYVSLNNKCDYNSTVSKPTPAQSCHALLVKTHYMVVCLVVSTISILLATLRMVHQWQASQTLTTLYFSWALSLSSILAPLYCLIVLLASFMRKNDFIYFALHWVHSFTCSLASILFLISYFMTRYFIILTSITTLLITRFVFIRKPFSKNNIAVLTLVGVLLCSVFSALYRIYVPRKDWLCFPLSFQQENVVFTTVYLGSTLLLIVSVIVINIYVVYNVAQTEKRAKRKKKTYLIIRQQTILTTIIESISWLLIILLSSQDVVLGDVNINIKFITITMLTCVNSSLHMVHYSASSFIRRRGRRQNCNVDLK